MPREWMPHVPKRAVQHGVFVSGEEVSPPCLKPGQTELFRRTTPAVLKPDSFRQQALTTLTEYSASLAQNTTPWDYANPIRPFRRPVATATNGSFSSRGSSSSAHWQSEYRAASKVQDCATPRCEASKRTSLPLDSLGCVEHLSAYLADFGRFGSNPRDQISSDDTKLPVCTNSLTHGSTKGTMHTPGYQGFIPSSTISMEVARVAAATQARSVDKTNIVDIFQAEVAGYGGHVPQSARNARSGPRSNVKSRSMATTMSGLRALS